jgi:DNA-binding GntR family transcriptional regulator
MPLDGTGFAARLQLRDGAAAFVRELVVSGQVRPGSHLKLQWLAEQLDLSVTPVREAMLLLAQDGWVVQEPHRGFRVAPIRRVDVSDAYLVHAFVGGELAARAAARAEPAHIKRLRDLDDRIRSLARSNERDSEELNYELHSGIYSIASSARLRWFVDAAGRFVPRRFWATIPGWWKHNKNSHTPIIDALEARDAGVARDLMSTHLTHAGDLLVTHLDSIRFWDSDEQVPSGETGGPQPASRRDIRNTIPAAFRPGE